MLVDIVPEDLIFTSCQRSRGAQITYELAITRDIEFVEELLEASNIRSVLGNLKPHDI